ncbi:MAG: HlyC/CorC family transporter [bacterium]
MNDIPTSLLFSLLALLIIISGFFSSSETALMTLNRYRLRHLVKNNHKPAIKAWKLLQKPDRLIGLILLGNNFVNILASALATVIGIRLLGDAGIAVATVILTLIVLIFAEVAPKTIAALHPERIAFPASRLLTPLLKLFYPIVWVVNWVTNGFLRSIGIPVQHDLNETLSRDELKTIVAESTDSFPLKHRTMLLNLIDLEQVEVDDIMVPRQEIIGIDLNQDWPQIAEQLVSTKYTRMPLFFGKINNVVGILHIRTIIRRMATGELNKDNLKDIARHPYYIPAGTSLTRQLLEFQTNERRQALVVDEYGDIQGLVTLDDILEEIVGEFTTEPMTRTRNFSVKPDGSIIIQGNANIRTLNRRMGWNLPSDASTLNGLLQETLESMPQPDVEIRIGEITFTILQVEDKSVKTVKAVTDVD